MTHDLRTQAWTQEGIVARWHLVGEGVAPGAADWAMRELRRPFSGVSVTGWGPVTVQQQRWAATLTAPDTALSLASAGGFWKIRHDLGYYVTVTRPGTRGRTRSGRLHVCYSKTLAGNVVVVNGLRVTTPERTIIDLWPSMDATARSKMLREALRLQVTNPLELLAVLHTHRGRRGVARLRDELLRRMHLPFHRCRSDAEAFALVVLDDAGIPPPHVNKRFAGEEADLCWPERQEIIEIDGPQFHRFKDEDARKTAIWTAAGLRVRRISSDLLFTQPSQLLLLAPPPLTLPRTR